MLALEEARRMNRPQVDFVSTYTMAAGGRDIELPLGDLMNPVYSTLNAITMTNNFPQIENESVTFLPHNFYDSRIRITQPIINREIYFNRKIKQELIGINQAEIQAYKRQLARDVKMAYYQYLQASEAVGIYDNALELLAENLRVNESLLRNDKVIPSVVLRVKSEIVHVEAQRNEAVANQQNAKAYFNFLLNKPLDEDIEVDVIDESDALELNGSLFAAGNREELQQLQSVQAVNSLVAEMERSYKVPTVGAQVEVGSQNFDFKYGGYVLAGLSLEVPIYAGNRNKLQAQQAELDILSTNEKISQIENQIELQTATAQHSLDAAISTLRSYQLQLDSAQRQYRDTFRRYKEGVSNYIELLDARTQITNIELQRSLSLHTVLLNRVELEYATASYPIP